MVVIPNTDVNASIFKYEEIQVGLRQYVKYNNYKRLYLSLETAGHRYCSGSGKDPQTQRSHVL